MSVNLSALIVSAVLLASGFLSVPAQAEQQRGKQGSSQQQGNKEARDARDEKDATPQDKKIKPSRDTSGLKDTSHQQGTSKQHDSTDSRDARDEKEAGSGSSK